MPPKCSVRTCGANKVKFYYFPTSDRNRLKIWMEFCDDPGLSILSVAQLKRKVICGAHFHMKYMLNNRLSKSAVPSLNPPGEAKIYI